ncbi:MAG TPA: PmoA family protein [Blastocatellia bacterium]|nr:PmoA family protein [Blastocatellia bacterium]
MKKFAPISILTLVLLQLSQLPQSAASLNDFSVTVNAGTLDRRDSIVTFDLPSSARGTSWILRDQSGATIPLQVDSERRARFILKELAEGTARTYRLEPARAAASASRVESTKEGDLVKVAVAGREVLHYRGGKGDLPEGVKPIFRRGGYIHPVLTPSGRLVTDDYPPAHLHHHGIWSPWTKTEFEGRHPDFWNMGDGTGTVEFVSLGEVWAGEVDGGFTSKHRFMDLSAPTPKVALDEIWEVTVYNVGDGTKPYRMFDVETTQTTASSSPLILPEYHYGGMGFRGHRQWDGKGNATFLTSEGYGRLDGHGTRARWCHIGGKVDGELAGVAILGHPANFRAPQPMRLHPTEPFFCFAPSQLGRWGIAPGHPYKARYRFVVSDGPPDAKEIERMWNDFAYPPAVMVAGR